MQESSESFNDSFLLNLTTDSNISTLSSDKSFNVSELTEDKVSTKRKQSEQYVKLLEQKEKVIAELRGEITSLLRYKQETASKAIDVALIEEKFRLQQTNLQNQLRVVQEANRKLRYSEQILHEKLLEVESSNLELSKDFNLTMNNVESALVEKENKRKHIEERLERFKEKIAELQKTLKVEQKSSKSSQERLKHCVEEKDKEINKLQKILEGKVIELGEVKQKIQELEYTSQSKGLEANNQVKRREEVEREMHEEHLRCESLQESFSMLEKIHKESTNKCEELEKNMKHFKDISTRQKASLQKQEEMVKRQLERIADHLHNEAAASLDDALDDLLKGWNNLQEKNLQLQSSLESQEKNFQRHYKNIKDIQLETDEANSIIKEEVSKHQATIDSIRRFFENLATMFDCGRFSIDPERIKTLPQELRDHCVLSIKQCRTLTDKMKEYQSSKSLYEDRIDAANLEIDHIKEELELIRKSKESVEKVLKEKIAELETVNEISTKTHKSHNELINSLESILISRWDIHNPEEMIAELRTTSRIVEELSKFCDKYEALKREKHKLRDDCETLRANLRTSKNALKALKQHMTNENKQTREKNERRLIGLKSAAKYSEAESEKIVQTYAENIQLLQNDLLNSKMENKKMQEALAKAESNLKDSICEHEAEVTSTEDVIKHLVQEKDKLWDWLKLIYSAYIAETHSTQDLAFQKSLLYRDVLDMYAVKESLMNLEQACSGIQDGIIKKRKSLRGVGKAVLAVIRLRRIAGRTKVRGKFSGISFLKPSLLKEIDLPPCDERHITNLDLCPRHVTSKKEIRINNGLCISRECGELIINIREMFVDLVNRSQQFQTTINKMHQVHAINQQRFQKFAMKYNTLIHERNQQQGKILDAEKQISQLEQAQIRMRAHCEHADKFMSKLEYFKNLQQRMRTSLVDEVEQQREKIINLEIELAETAQRLAEKQVELGKCQNAIKQCVETNETMSDRIKFLQQQNENKYAYRL